MIPTEKPISIYMKPNTLARVAEGRQVGSSTLEPSTKDNTINEYGKWFPCGTAADQTYYGLAVLFDTPGVNNDNQFQYYQKITYYVEFRGNRTQV